MEVKGSVLEGRFGLEASGGSPAAWVLQSNYQATGTFVPARVRFGGLPHRGSGGHLALALGETYYLPLVGTSPTVVDARTRDKRRPLPPASEASYNPTLALPAADLVREALAATALNKSLLADVLRISRPTLYEWLDGKEPTPNKVRRLVALVSLLERSGVTSETPLNARFVRHPVDHRGVSLLALLCEKHWDVERIGKTIAVARALDEEATIAAAARETRLRAMGYDEPSEEMERAQLARNIAQSDWPI